MELVHNNEQFALNKAFGVKEFGERLTEAMKRETQERTKTS